MFPTRSISHLKFFGLRRERGAAFILLAAITAAIIALIALLIDSARIELSAEQLQKTADASALSAAGHLDGSQQGWRNAKRAAFQIILAELSNIHGSDHGDLASLALNDGEDATIDLLETEEQFKNISGHTGNIDITIQRGAYWNDAETNTFRFISLESGKLEGGVPVIYNMPVFMMANAVHVTVKLNRLGTTFARIFGATNFNDVARSSTALSDNQLEVCAAPIAIPACNLLLNTSKEADESRYLTDTYNPVMQCEREVVASEANREVDARRDGIARSESYPRPPFLPAELGEAPRLNKRAIPIQGILGLADGTVTPRRATPREVADFFKSTSASGGCANVKLGTPFRPLNRLFDDHGTGMIGTATELLNNVEVEDSIATLINNGDTSFNAAFGFFHKVCSQKNGNHCNYPHLRNLRTDHPDPFVELRLTWPLPGATDDDNSEGSMIMSPAGGGVGNYVNPMCHSDKVKFPNDPANAKVKAMHVMVIAPTAEDAAYCDFESLFAGNQQNAVAPEAESHPMVIGFVKAYLYDFNTMDLDLKFASTGGTPVYSGPPGRPIIDRNPLLSNDTKGQDFFSKAANEAYQDWASARESWAQCIESNGANPNAVCSSLGEYCCECFGNVIANHGEGVVATPYDDYNSCASECHGFPEAIGCGPEPQLPVDWDNWEGGVIDLLGRWEKCMKKCTKDKTEGECIADSECGPQPEESDSDEDEDSPNSWWNGKCFRRINKGVSDRSSIYKRTIGGVHPLLLQDPTAEGYIDRKHFFADPTRYYAELKLAAIVTGMQLEQIPDLSELDGNPEALEEFISNISDLIVVSGSVPEGKLSLKLFARIFDYWMRENRVSRLTYRTAYNTDNPTLVNDTPYSTSQFFDLLTNVVGVSGKTFGLESNDLVNLVKGYPEDGLFHDDDDFDKDVVRQVLRQAYIGPRRLMIQTGVSVIGKHCLPVKKDNVFPEQAPTSWHQPRERSAQYGCGGLRLRLDCTPDRSFTSPKAPSKRTPAIVN